MTTQINGLTFALDLIDRVSGPMGKIMQTIDRAGDGFQKGFTQIGVGAAGLVGAAYSMDRLLEPTKEMYRAIGQVKSLGVADDKLNDLRNSAIKFSQQYGVSAAEVVISSYDIQSAISGLKGNELEAFTRSAALLAKGTKASFSDMTNYVGKMYGVFQASADKMGRAEWIEKMTAHTAMAVNIFKTEGKTLAAAFEGIGALAEKTGVSMAEQFAVLGQLQSGWSGSEAGTKYKQFLNTVTSAQEDLGLSFVDSKNHLLPMYEILSRINNKFTDLKDVTQLDTIKAAFGDDGAMAVTFLLDKIDLLKSSTEAIASQTTLDSLNKMADAMTDPWSKMNSGVNAISMSIGTKLLPVLIPVIDSANAMLQKFFAWTDANPVLARNLGLATLGVIGITAAIAAFGMGAGFATLMTTGWGLAMATITSPITGTILGVTALIAAVTTVALKWDEWGGAILYVGQAITDAFGITEVLTTFWNFLTNIYNGWSMIFSIIYNNAGGILSFIGEVVTAVGRIVDILGRAMGFGPLLDWVQKLFSTIISGWKMIGQIALPNWIQSGLGINTGPVSTSTKAKPKGGGIIKQMSSVMNANKSTSFGDVHIHTQNGPPLQGARFAEEFKFTMGG